jgi:hypothetical protein
LSELTHPFVRVTQGFVYSSLLPVIPLLPSEKPR